MHRIFAGIVSAAVLFCAPAAAQSSAGVAGVWQGTVGGQQIRACFNQRESSTFGAYYYLNHLVSIPLQQPDDKKLTFVEGGDERDLGKPPLDLRQERARPPRRHVDASRKNAANRAHAGPAPQAE